MIDITLVTDLSDHGKLLGLNRELIERSQRYIDDLGPVRELECSVKHLNTFDMEYL